MDYFEWESAVIEAVAEVMSISHSDATGFVEAQPFYMQQSWGKSMDAQHAAAKLIKAAQAETGTPKPCRQTRGQASRRMPFSRLIKEKVWITERSRQLCKVLLTVQRSWP